MDEVDALVVSHGVYPVAFDRSMHTGLHLTSRDKTMPVRAIADGTVVAYRVCQKPLPDMNGKLVCNGGFVLLKHEKETGINRKLVFYSLYMHLLDLEGLQHLGMPPIQDIAQQKPHVLPLWLQCPTGVAVSGGDETVLRKDIIGYQGSSHEVDQLHFEIFMTPPDFEAYFGATQLGASDITTPAGADCWGHTYYVIPPQQTFLPLPPYTAPAGQLDIDVKLQETGPNERKSPHIAFETLQRGKNAGTLYVEVYFYLGAKYTRVWCDTGDGAPSLLTAQPACEVSYEYGMYERARTLYGACPSDGYELLRFGRILGQPTLRPSPPPINADLLCPAQLDERQTWFRVTYAPGEEGYIDINARNIQKVSDADFPFFMGWRKIPYVSPGPGVPLPTPKVAPQKLSDDRGLWDPRKAMLFVNEMTNDADALRDIVRGSGTKLDEKKSTMKRIVSNPAVRALFKGFICEAPSEWDAANLETRYTRLLEPDQIFEGKKPEYDKFIAFVKQFQFWDKTGLPTGKNLWFFHPLAFIRHFRKCSWLSEQEMQQMLPVSYIAESGGSYAIDATHSDIFITQTRLNLNKTLCKYGITTPARMSAFFGQAVVETSWFRTMEESGGNQAKYAPWYGRGFLQITNSDGEKNLKSSSYYNYFRWRGRFPEQASSEQIAQWREDVAARAKDDAAESAGFYWIYPQFGFHSEHYAERPSYYADIPNPNIRVIQDGHAYYSNESARRVAAYVNIPGAIYQLHKINNLPERYSCFSNALVVITDTPVFPVTNVQQNDEIPEGFSLRHPW